MDKKQLRVRNLLHDWKMTLPTCPTKGRCTINSRSLQIDFALTNKICHHRKVSISCCPVKCSTSGKRTLTLLGLVRPASTFLDQVAHNVEVSESCGPHQGWGTSVVEFCWRCITILYTNTCEKHTKQNRAEKVEGQLAWTAFLTASKSPCFMYSRGSSLLSCLGKRSGNDLSLIGRVDGALYGISANWFVEADARAAASACSILWFCCWCHHNPFSPEFEEISFLWSYG